ncbi:hypothetical protein HOY80DRAFT_885763 [Tuber brumale]|nr:hypothetical protein HOY80DRAFT_885763 [Tuber brumale]
MGNRCSCSQSIREMRTEIGGLRKNIAKLARDRVVLEVQAGVEELLLVAYYSGGGIYSQATVATRSWAVGRYRSSEESRPAEEFVVRARRSRNYGRGKD